MLMTWASLKFNEYQYKACVSYKRVSGQPPANLGPLKYTIIADVSYY